MITQIPSHVLNTSRRGLLALAAFATFSAHAAVTVDFGESMPTTDIITSYDAFSDNGQQWRWLSGAKREVSQSFIVPSGTDFAMDSITMRFDATYSVFENYPDPSGFVIAFYELTGPSQNPVDGVSLGTQSGFMQPTLAEATPGSYFSFQLGTPLLLESGKSYAYTLSFAEETSYNRFQLAEATVADPNGTQVWWNQDDGGWVPTGTTYLYTIQGTAVPEPGTVVLLALAGLSLYARRKMLKSLEKNQSADGACVNR